VFESGDVPDALLDGFKAALRERFGPRARFVVLSPADEAEYERCAAEYIFGKFVHETQEHAPTSIISGGGASVQFYCGSTSASRAMPTRTKEKLVHDDNERPVDKRATLEKLFVDEMNTPEPLPLMTGCIIGLNAFEDLSQLGFGEEWLGRKELLKKLDKLINDLLNKKGRGWKEAVTKWRERVGQLWVIGVIGTVRLRVLVEHAFDDDSRFYFANAPPGTKALTVSWPLGRQLVGQDEELFVSRLRGISSPGKSA